ncbi:MAG TPA: methyltransferase, partial [Gammaproteobacteria bacterium]|nr:methyltransferase [Gammaproteobacteria bacterium]
MAEQILSLLSEELETYVQLHCQPEDKLLQELRAETHKTLQYPQMQVGPVEGALLRLLVSISGASNVLEIGTFSGYSALCMAAALPDNGRLVTCDIDPVATAVAQRYFNRSPYGNRITLCIGDAI